MTPRSASGSRPTRRTRAEVQVLRDELYLIVQQSAPTTARFTFYVAAARHLVPKTTAGYRTVQRLLAMMREEGELPFAWIADNTRWMRKPTTFDSVEECLAETAATYRRALWSRSEVYVEVWAESDSVAGVIDSVTAEFDVPLMVLRGYSSKTFAYAAAKQIEADGRPAVLYYFGDHDPSGLDIERSLRESLRRYAPKADITLQRVAVTAEDIEMFDLPGSIKKPTDTRSKGFEGMAVEIESLPTETLREWCRGFIEQHVDRRQLELLQVAEDSERTVLLAMAGRST